MNFKPHSDLQGLHAFLSPSMHSWINYDLDKMTARYLNHQALERGVRMHELARHCIELRQRLQKSDNPFNLYVNDAIGYDMVPEQVLYFSVNAFGTADAISFREKTNFLRIHDLKTGVTPVSMHQLEIYAALFCLEYNKNPANLKMELRIYQKEILVDNPLPETIQGIMDKIVLFDQHIEKLKAEER